MTEAFKLDEQMMTEYSKSMTHSDWIEKAGRLFNDSRPEHFTNYNHCDECFEHDETLRSYDPDSIGIDQLGSPAWDPICFSSTEGKKYYMPAMIRLALQTLNDELYIEQLLFHLALDGPENDLYLACTGEQRRFIAEFCSYILEHYTEEVDLGFLGDDLMSVYQIWSGD